MFTGDSFPLSTETAQEVPRSPYDGLIKGGDMLIGDAIEDEVHEAGSRKRRAAYKHPFLRWPSSTIPYKFDTISNVCKYYDWCRFVVKGKHPQKSMSFQIMTSVVTSSLISSTSAQNIDTIYHNVESIQFMYAVV